MSICQNASPRKSQLMLNSFVMSERMKRISPDTQSFLLCCLDAVSSVSFRQVFLLSNHLVVEVAEGCCERKLFWPGARVCCWLFGMQLARHAGYYLYVWVCVLVYVCVCVPWESLAVGVTYSNGKLCCTVQNLFWTGSPIVSSAKHVTEQQLSL